MIQRNKTETKNGVIEEKVTRRNILKGIAAFIAASIIGVFPELSGVKQVYATFLQTVRGMGLPIVVISLPI